jgi:hypothetical protein
MKHFFKRFTNHRSFQEDIEEILEIATLQNEIRIGQIFSILAEKGRAALLIIFSLPFCLPIQIPGLSTPFGILLALLGSGFIFPRPLYAPKWILEKKISSTAIHQLTSKIFSIIKFLKKISSVRLVFFTRLPFLRVNGILILFLSILLALPLPLPFTNLLSAIPILLISLGLLEDDGLFILIGYLISLICFAFFAALFIISAGYLSLFFKNFMT